MTLTTMVVAATAMKIKAATAMVGGTDINQLKTAAEEMAAAAVLMATARRRVTATATKQCQQWCIGNSNDNNVTRKCLRQWLRQL